MVQTFLAFSIKQLFLYLFLYCVFMGINLFVILTIIRGLFFLKKTEIDPIKSINYIPEIYKKIEDKFIKNYKKNKFYKDIEGLG
jgi:hypothetical protein